MFCIFIFLSLQVVWSLLCGFVVAPEGLPLPAEVNGQVWNVEELVIGYFVLGYTAVQIHHFLSVCQGVLMSIRRLRRLMWRLGLRVYGQQSDFDDTVSAIRTELANSGRLLGYRLMWRRLNCSTISA